MQSMTLGKASVTSTNLGSHARLAVQQIRVPSCQGARLSFSTTPTWWSANDLERQQGFNPDPFEGRVVGRSG